MVLKISEQSNKMLNELADMKKMPKDKLVEQLVEEAWEDEWDRIDAEEALKEFEANPVTYTFDEIKAELGLNIPTYEIKMTFKESADMDEIAEEINMISERANVEVTEKEEYIIAIGTEDFNRFVHAYICLSYSEIVKLNLLDALWKDKKGTASCKKGLLAPIE